VQTLRDELATTADRESVVQAWVARHDDDQLLAALEQLPPGPLAGWTLGVKDVIDTAELPTERGSPIYKGRTTMNDASCVALARRAGALVVGKTATTEFALFTPTVTTNPHDSSRTPGGSSSGSAAAVAAGMVRAAFGTQTVGSVIRPASYCGVVGFKGTHQLVPMSGVGTLAQSLDTLGWFTRSVADAATMFGALTGQSVLSTSPPAEPPRLGVYRSHQWDSAQPEMGAILEAAAEQLAQSGAEVVEVDPLPHLEHLFEAANTILLYEAARVFEWERRSHWELISPLLQRMLTRSDNVSVADYGEAQQLVHAAKQQHDQFMADGRFDALLTPASPGEAPPLKTTGDSVFNREWTTLGVPAATLPCFSGPMGLPVGIQFTGSRWNDLHLLETTRWAEAALMTGDRS
jgi:Asp-tRNA(Asn)/Glu-tRNA(Gln) amidotransferase A subunit family amidase